MQSIRHLPSDRLEFFAPASSEQREWIANAYRGFDLAEYLALLSETDGVGELFAEGGHRFVHNMLVFSAAEAMDTSESEFQGRRLAIGAPGVDGILYVLQPSRAEVFAYYPVEEQFTSIAPSVYALLQKWVTGELRL